MEADPMTPKYEGWRTTYGDEEQGLPVQARQPGTCTICHAPYKAKDRVIRLSKRQAAHPDCAFSDTFKSSESDIGIGERAY